MASQITSFPSMTIAERNALTAVPIGSVILNSDNSQFEMWNGTLWIGQTGNGQTSSTFPINMRVNGSGSWTAGNPIALSTIEFDSNLGYNTSTGQYTVPFSGYYLVGWDGNVTSGTKQVQIYVNGVGVSDIIDNGGSLAGGLGLATSLKLNKGDIVTWVANLTFATNITAQWIVSTFLTQGTIQTTGIVANVGFNGTVSVGSSPVQIIYDTVIGDTNNAYNPSTGVYTISAAGWYDIVASGNTSVGVHDNFLVGIYQNGTRVAYNNEPVGNAPSIGVLPTPSVTTKILCAIGDQITVQVQNQNGNVTTWGGDSTSNFLCISSITSTGLSRIVKSNSTGTTGYQTTAQGPMLDSGGINPISCPVYCNGGDVEIGFQDDGSGNAGYLGIDQTPTYAGIYLYLYRDGVLISTQVKQIQNNISVEINFQPSGGAYKFIDTPTVGLHTYTMQAALDQGPRSGNNGFLYSVMYARPLA